MLLRCDDMNRPFFFDVNEGLRYLPPKAANIKAVRHIKASEGARRNRRIAARQSGAVLLSKNR